MNVWQQVLDEELLTWGLVAKDDATYEEAKETLNRLLWINQQIATDPKVNGGYILVPLVSLGITVDMLEQSDDI